MDWPISWNDVKNALDNAGGGYDMVITDPLDDTKRSILTGSFEDLKAKILAGEMVRIDVYENDGHNRYFYPVLRILYDEEDDEIEITVMTYNGTTSTIYVD